MSLTNQQIIGDIGEIVYHACFGGIPSDDMYDRNKDLTDEEGNEVEIKTQVRYNSIDAFTVNKAHTNNLRKCLTVKRLIFIEYGKTNEIIFYECTDREYFTVKTSSGKVMACFPIDKMTVLKKIKNRKLADLLRHFSTSKAV